MDIQQILIHLLIQNRTLQQKLTGLINKLSSSDLEEEKERELLVTLKLILDLHRKQETLLINASQ